jgi:2-phosphosulfolactate phosphatase
MRSIFTCVSPALLDTYEFENQTVVVIDVLRATSSMCLAMYNGAKGIIPVLNPESCLAYSDFPDYILAAERNGEVVEGFDVGNSPLSYSREKVENKTIVISTTNGTKAINKSTGARNIVIGSFLNLEALCSYLRRFCFVRVGKIK